MYFCFRGNSNKSVYSCVGIVQKRIISIHETRWEVMILVQGYRDFLHHWPADALEMVNRDRYLNGLCSLKNVRIITHLHRLTTNIVRKGEEKK